MEVDKHMDIDGFRHIDFTNPSNESGNIPSTGPDPVTYQCSIQASCITVIRVFVLLNTLESVSSRGSPINPLPDDKILHRSKLEQIADDILRCF